MPALSKASAHSAQFSYTPSLGVTSRWEVLEGIMCVRRETAGEAGSTKRSRGSEARPAQQMRRPWRGRGNESGGAERDGKTGWGARQRGEERAAGNGSRVAGCSVLEVAHAGGHEHDAVLVAAIDRVLVAHAAAGVHDRAHARLQGGGAGEARVSM